MAGNEEEPVDINRFNKISLEQLAAELHTRHGTRSEVIPADLSDSAEPKRIATEIEQRGIDIELLVNDAGFGLVSEVEQTDVDRIRQMIQVNMASLAELTYRILPGMLKREHGGIINVSSRAAFQPVAFMGVYAATKVFVLHFSEALWAEVRDRGVTVTAVCPGTTRTEFFDVSGVPGWLKKRPSLSTEQVVNQSLKALEKRRLYVVPGWRDYLMSLAVRLGSRSRVVSESKKYFRPTPAKEQSETTDDSS